MSKTVSKNINKSLYGRCSQKLLDHGKKVATCAQKNINMRQKNARCYGGSEINIIV